MSGVALCATKGLLRKDGQAFAHARDTRFTKPMLYPLSYEGLTCEFTG